MPIPFDVDREAVAAFCEANGIRRLAFFGSVVREDFGPGSDVDVLVEFEEGRTPGFFGLMRMQRELGVLLGVDAVDLRTPDDLSPRFRDEVLTTAEVQYGEA